MSKKYTEEQIKWLKENGIQYYIEDLTLQFNNHFNTDYTNKSIKRTMEHRKIPRKLHNKIDYLKRRTKIYEDYHFKWIKENRDKYNTIQELHNAFNNHFQLNTTFSSFKTNINRNKIYDTNRKYPKKYTQEENNWIIENYKNYVEDTGVFSPKKFIKDFNKLFNSNMRVKDVRPKLRTLGIKQPKSLSYYDRWDIGHETKFGSDNTWYIKVSNKIRTSDRYSLTLNYRRKSHVLYEQYYNTKVNDKTEVVIHIDKNNNNFEKENLYKISRKAYKIYGGSKFNNQTLETRLNALKVCEILQLIKETQ